MSDSASALPENSGPAPRPTPAPAAPPAGDAERTPTPRSAQPGTTNDKPQPGSDPTGGPGDGSSAARRRRRGSRGGRNRSRGTGPNGNGSTANGNTSPERPAGARPPAQPGSAKSSDAKSSETRASDRKVGDAAVSDATPVADRWSEPAGPDTATAPAGPRPPRPKIGDSRPAPPPAGGPAQADDNGDRPKRNRSGSRRSGGARRGGRSGGSGAPAPKPVEATLVDDPAEVDEATLAKRKGRERKGRPVGRYLMVVHVDPRATQIAVLEGRNLLEHYVSRPSDDANQIDGNIYVGRVKNVLPGMEAAFVDIGTPKNAVLYRGDIRYDGDDVDGPEEKGGGDGGGRKKGKGGKPTRGNLSGPAKDARIEQLLSPGQMVVCQVTKNPIGHKGARLTQEVSLPGRFVVLVPNSDTYGISKRLADNERKRLRKILDEIRPAGHGLIVRTAAEGATEDELNRDVARLLELWTKIDALAGSARQPGLVYREPDMAVRVIREEFNRNYRGVVIDNKDLYEEVKGYVASITPELADRVELARPEDDPLPVFERHHIHEQIHRALDKKVWLPSGGSLIIERTEALTVIDVNTGKNVGRSNLEETVYRNNLEAAEEIAHQLRLRDIGGIIVIDFIDMEIAANRAEVIKTFRAALARDKTRTQVFDISELGLVEMTRKRVSEGLVESYSHACPTCGGRGIEIDESLFS